MRIYATAAEAEAGLLGICASDIDLPRHLTPWLRLASGLVDRATFTAHYATDAEGYPTDLAIREAFRDAVVAHVSYWLREGIDPSRGPSGIAGTGEVTETKLGSGSVKLDSNGARRTDARVTSLRHLTDEALLYLHAAGVLRGQPSAIGSGRYGW